jgi:hypothetical protein
VEMGSLKAVAALLILVHAVRRVDISRGGHEADGEETFRKRIAQRTQGTIRAVAWTNKYN